jgi:AraC-like DNA-binding protein
MDTSNQLDPGVMLVLLVDGATELSCGRHRFQLGPRGADPAQRGSGALVNLAEEDLFSRRWLAGRTERKVSLTLTPQWMEEGGLAAHGDHAALRTFCREHMARRSWKLSPRAEALARRILEPPSFEPGLSRLRLEARCIELAAEALTAIGDAAPEPSALREIDRWRLRQLVDLLRAAAGAAPSTALSMAAIAREVGSNPMSLQALTRRAWGCSVFERLRTLRLDRAQAMLLRGASVAEAATVAGYAAATNFATAYRRRFGCTPRQALRGGVASRVSAVE